MDKKLILAVAGSGKTQILIDKLNLSERFIVVTYTNNNMVNISYRIKMKFGLIPDNIKLFTFFEFLYRFCYRPYLADMVRDLGINFDQPDNIRYCRKQQRQYYIDKFNKLYYNRISLLLIVYNIIEPLAKRIDKYFDYFMVDETQDLGGNDFDMMLSLNTITCKQIFVGDYNQRTFSTSCDGRKNAGVFKDEETYINRFLKEGFDIDSTTLSKSHRCPKAVCDFVTDNLGIHIMPVNQDKVTDVREIEDDEIDYMVADDTVVKLFYQKHSTYDCHSCNWAESKGIDKFKDVCVVLNKGAYDLFRSGNLLQLSPLTKRKLYVACTRAKGNLYFVKEDKLNNFKK